MNTKHWKLLMAPALALALVVALLPQLAWAAAPNYYTSVIVSDVSDGAPVIGGTFQTDVSVSIENNTTPPLGIMGVDLWLQFDSTILGVDDADDNPSNGVQVEVQTDFFGGSVVVAENEVTTCPSGGDCVHLALSHTGSPVTNRTGKIATITWAGLAMGDAGLAVTAETVLADIDGNDVPINSTTVPAIVVVEPGFIEGTVERQGTRTDHAGVDVIAYNASGGVVGNTTTAADGSFVLNVPLGGTYLVQALYNGYLKTQKSNVYVVGGTVNLGTTTLLGGDVNSDNNVNILDIVSIINRYGTTGWPATEATDINDDGSVNIFDLTIAAGNFGRYGPLSW